MNLLFCKDQILRVESITSNSYIPAMYLQKNLEYSDFEFFSLFFKNDFKLERDITFGEFLTCLEPWVDFFTILCKRDISAFMQELKKPIDSSKITKDSFIEINFDKTVRQNKNKTLRLDSFMTVSEKKPNDANSYVLTYDSFNELRDLPLKIMTNYQLSYLTIQSHSIFNGAHLLVNKDQHNFDSIIIENNINFFEFITQFWDNFLYSPEVRKHEELKLIQAIQAFDQQDISEHSFNDISDLKVNVATNAFEPIISSFSTEKNNWDNVIQLAKEDNVVIRIGIFNENTISHK